MIQLLGILIMKHQKILNLLNKVNDSKFVTREWNIVSANLNANYGVGNEINYNTEVLKSNLCDYSDTYILVKGDITVTAAPEAQVAITNCASFTKCIIKIDGATMDDAENLDLVMTIYKVIEYSSNYSETTGNLWFYSKNEAANFNADIGNTDDFKSFKYKAKLLGNTAVHGANRMLKNAKIAVSLKYLSSFWRSLEMPLISCKVELKLKRKKYCVSFAAVNDNINENANVDNIIFTIKDTKLYFAVVTLSASDNQKLSKLLSKGFERLVYCKEYKTKSEDKNTTNEFRYFLWKSKTRVTSSNSQVTSSNPRLTSSIPRVTSSNPRVRSSNLRVTSSNPPSYQFKFMSWKIKSTSWDTKSASWEIKV